MSNITIALVFVLTLNVLMAMAQISVINLSEDGDMYIFNPSGNLVKEYSNGGVSDTKDATLKESYPDVAVIEPSSGNPFTDLVSSIKSWFSGAIGLKYVKAIVMGPSNILKSMNIPNEFSFLLGAFWHLLTIFVIIAFFWGK